MGDNEGGWGPTVFGEGGYSMWFVDGFFDTMSKHGFEEACGMISRQGRDMILARGSARLSQEQMVYLKMLDL